MPRPHYTEASVIVQRTIRGWLSDDKPPAESWIDAAACAKSYGYDYDAPSTPKTDELERLKKKGDALAIAEFRRAHALTLAAETRAAAWWASTRAWAKTDPAKLTKAADAERKHHVAELDKKIHVRAGELLALANGTDGKRRALLPADALEQARRELGVTL